MVGRGGGEIVVRGASGGRGFGSKNGARRERRDGDEGREVKVEGRRREEVVTRGERSGWRGGEGKR